MKKLKELKRGDSFEGLSVFVKATTQALTKTGKTYVRATLSDGTMDTTINDWDTTIQTSQYQLDKIYSLAGSVGEYNGNIQLNVTSSIDHPSKYLSDFLRQSERNIEDMMIELKNLHINRITHPLYSHLLKTLVIDDARFGVAPAAAKMHHPWVGGLLEHVLGLCTFFDAIYENHYKRYFPNLDCDLVKTSLILHDWGKVTEYVNNKPGFPTSPEGILMYHIGIVVKKVTIEAFKLEGDGSTEQDLVHCLYAHHGLPEWQSLIRPALPEALFVHWLDNFDAQIMNMRESLQGPEGNVPGFSVKNFAHGTMYRMQSLEDQEQNTPF